MEETRLRVIYKDISRFLSTRNEPFVVVSIEDQTLFVCVNDEVVEKYHCSTSRFGNGNRENSNRTPLGIHRIREKYGEGAPERRIFKGRKDTGVDWEPGNEEDNLILARILRLEGLEEGVNKGKGIDSFDRYIYIHGTNREELIGTPLSHGCICMRNADVIRLFDRVNDGTIVYIDPLPIVIGGRECRNIHFAGIFGSGMSALAQYLRYQGIGVSGSDRFHDSDDTAFIRNSLEGIGCRIAAQDGSGIGVNTDAVCVSTAIEDDNPDMAAARNHRVPVIHRSDLLAAIMETRKSIAVAGTSGKSTVTAMIFEFLTACGKSPSLISGAGLRRLEGQGLIGNAWSGGSDLLVVEADESDGTIVKYRPEASVILNVSRDHKTVEEIKGLFERLASQSAWTSVNADDPLLASIPASERFGKIDSDKEELLPTSVRLHRDGIEYHLPLPGEHNLENLRAALSVCGHYGCEPSLLADAVRRYEGVARRFHVINTTGGVTVVDDFAHNPAKIAAVVRAARGLSRRIIAVYQPHGFAPTRFLKDEYIVAFKSSFKDADSLYLLPIYYAGGTAQKNISSGDIISGLGPVAFRATAASGRDELIELLIGDVKPGDCLLVMGARDPSISSLVKRVVDAFGGENQVY